MTPKSPNALPKIRMTARSLVETKRIGEMRLHPDGQRVVFVATEADFDESTHLDHLWLTEYVAPCDEVALEDAEAHEAVDGAAQEAHDYTRQLTFSREGETQPRWSPDGRYLAFVSSRPDPLKTLGHDDEEEPKPQLWLLPMEGGEPRKVTSTKEGVLAYSWTAESDALIYMTPEPRPRPIESLRKEERERHRNDPTVEHEEFLRRQFWRVATEGDKANLLFTADAGTEEFELAPNGERIAFVTNYTGDPNDYLLADIYIRDLKRQDMCKLVKRGGAKYHLRWSLDGKFLAFITPWDEKHPFSRETVACAEVPETLPEGCGYSAEAEGMTTLRLFAELDYDVSEVEWTKENNALIALASVGTGTEIFQLDLAGGFQKLDLGGRGERRTFAFEPETGAMAYAEESADHLVEVSLREGSGEIHALTKLNVEFIETYRMPRQEVVSWVSEDGTPIEGVLTYPLDFEAGKRVPLLVQIHGGPKGRSANSLRNYYLTPLWASEGYAVLQPNFRGSAGYGNAFAVANYRDIGGGDFADIMAGVDWCIAQGVADPERLGVMGGSYGGFMTNWAIGHTNRFRAAASMFGIFHLQTDYSNSTFPGWDSDYLGATYWEDPEIYRKLSPGTYLANIQTPTLVIHGDDDNNTFISNSKELYQVLKHRKVPTQFVHYPREGHGVGEPNHKMDEVRRCLEWMDRYLKHGGEKPSVYRFRERVPSADGLLELCVVCFELGRYVGHPKSNKEEATALWELHCSLRRREPDTSASPLAFCLSDLRLVGVAGEASFAPVGVPLETVGGKIWLEGSDLRLIQHPDSETGELSFGVNVVFCLPKTRSEYDLRVVGFPPVRLLCNVEEDETTPEEEGV